MADEHNPGDLPLFMKERGIQMIVTGGMGPRARDYFESFGIKTVVGAYGRGKDLLEEIVKGKVEYRKEMGEGVRREKERKVRMRR